MIAIIITSSTPAEITTTPTWTYSLLSILSLLLCIPWASSFGTELLP